MADYRQDCNFPGCGYTGFAPHSEEHLKILAEYNVRAKEQQEKKRAAALEPYMGLEPEDLFNRVLDLRTEMFNAQRALNAAEDTIKERDLTDEYLNYNWKRKKSTND